MSSLRDNMAVEIRAAAGNWLDMESARVLADGALRALRPIGAVEDSKPVVIYFANEADREEFIQVFHDAKPTALTVAV